MLSAVRPSVRLSVTRVDQSKTVEVRIMKFSPHGSPISLVFVGSVSSGNYNGSPPLPSGASNKGEWENKPFSSFKRQYLKTVGDTSKVTIND